MNATAPVADRPATKPPVAVAPRALVILDPEPQERGGTVDWSAWYLEDEDDSGQGGEQNQIIKLLGSSLEVLARERRWRNVLIASDQFFGWVEGQPKVRVSPDVYVLDDPPAPPLPAMWQTWLPGHRPPRFALEVVSGDDWRKDYTDNPPKYAQLGADELPVFDPRAAAQATPGSRSDSERIALQVFRRAPDGAFVRVYVGPGPVWCQEIEAGAVVHRVGSAARLRLSRDAAGQELVPTEAEAIGSLERELAELRARLQWRE